MTLKCLLGLMCFQLAICLSTVLHAADSDVISSTGGRYFQHRVELPVPYFAQDDPQWSKTLLGPSTDTLGDEGCAVTSGAMVMAFYGVKTNPQKLNAFLTRTGGFSSEGYIHWSHVPAIAPGHLELMYDGAPSHELIDANLIRGNPVIVVIPLPQGAYHFVVIVGKEGHDYLIRNPAASFHKRAYPLRIVTDKISGLCFFRMI